MSNAIDDVIRERRHQVEREGYTAGHDDAHRHRELAQAAACYVDQHIGRSWVHEHDPDKYQDDDVPRDWPWDDSCWKPKTPRRDLIRAAALIIAEIERLDRLSA